MQLVKLASLLLAVLPVLSAQPDRLGLPACTASGLELARRSAFVLCYSSALKVPVWTAYELTPAQLHGSAARPSRFRRDPALAGPIAQDRDYRGSGFSRGHMVPAEDVAWSDASIGESFLLSNVAPQRQHMNAGRWRQLENAVRRLAARSDTVLVFTGPVFDSREPEFIGPDHVAVPSHFFKVILAVHRGEFVMYAAIIPNSNDVRQPLARFTVTVDEVERRTGLDFFSGLDDSEEDRLESANLASIGGQ